MKKFLYYFFGSFTVVVIIYFAISIFWNKNSFSSMAAMAFSKGSIKSTLYTIEVVGGGVPIRYYAIIDPITKTPCRIAISTDNGLGLHCKF